MMLPTVLFDAWTAMMWRACWQGSLVVLAVWSICRLMPSMPARFQCWFWRLAVLKFVIVLLLPSLLDLPLLPAPAVGTHVEARLPVATTVPVRQTAQVRGNVANTTEWPSLPTVLCYAWLVGIGCSFLRLSFAWNAARHLRKRSRATTDGPTSERLRVQTRLFGLRTTPKLLEAPGGGSPMLLGMFWPAIVIPAATRLRLNATELTMVLGHELAHIRRGDLFWGLLASLIRSVFFFHPLVWLCERQLRLAQEVAADELAILKQSHDPTGYGSLLVSVVGKLGSKKGSRAPVSAVSLETAGPVHSLTRRLVAMTRFGRTSRRALVGSGALLGAVVLLGLVPWRLVAAEPKTDEKQPKHYYQANIAFNEEKKGQPERQCCAPTLVYHAGQWAFASCHVQNDKNGFLIVTVGTSPEGQPAEHTMQVLAARNPSGKALTKADEDQLFKALSKHVADVDPHPTVRDLPKGSQFMVTGSLSGGKPTLDGQMSIRCDGRGKLAIARGRDDDHFAWMSPKVMFTDGAIGKVMISKNDGSQLNINVTVSPTEEPKYASAVLAQLKEGDRKSSQHPAPPFFRTEADSYAIDVLGGGSRVGAVDKRTDKSQLLDVPENARVTDVAVGDNLAACVMHGSPVSQLIVFDNKMGKWSTFQLPIRNRPQDAEPIVGDHVACYQLKNCIVAYSATRHTWGMLATDATPAVGDFSVKAETATEKSVFTAQSGIWVTTRTRR